MSSEQLRETLDFAAATAAHGTPEQADLAGRADVRDDLADIRVPTLVISTTKDFLTSTALHQQLAETIPGAHLTEIDTGHLPMLERTNEWLNLITNFLTKHNP
jgi:pimeloyl-ACP methyl ester carboxylesterase